MNDSSMFKKWLNNNGTYSSKKQINDCVSRVKRAERALSAVWMGAFSLENEFTKDGGVYVRTVLSRRGLNPEMAELAKPALPIGSNQMDSIAAAVRKYYMFLEDTQRNG